MACFVQLNQLFFYFSFTVFYCFAPSVHSFAHMQAVFCTAKHIVSNIFFLYNLTDCFLFFLRAYHGQQAAGGSQTSDRRRASYIRDYIFLYSFIYFFLIYFFVQLYILLLYFLLLSFCRQHKRAGAVDGAHTFAMAQLCLLY